MRLLFIYIHNDLVTARVFYLVKLLHIHARITIRKEIIFHPSSNLSLSPSLLLSLIPLYFASLELGSLAQAVLCYFYTSTAV